MTRRSHRRYWILLLCLACVLAVYAQRHDFHGLYLEYRSSAQRVETLEGDVLAASAERSRMERQVEHLSSSPLEIEAAIRRGKSLVRAGEIVYRVELPEDALE